MNQYSPLPASQRVAVSLTTVCELHSSQPTAMVDGTFICTASRDIGYPQPGLPFSKNARNSLSRIAASRLRAHLLMGVFTILTSGFAAAAPLAEQTADVSGPLAVAKTVVDLGMRSPCSQWAAIKKHMDWPENEDDSTPPTCQVYGPVLQGGYLHLAKAYQLRIRSVSRNTAEVSVSYVLRGSYTNNWDLPRLYKPFSGRAKATLFLKKLDTRWVVDSELTAIADLIPGFQDAIDNYVSVLEDMKTASISQKQRQTLTVKLKTALRLLRAANSEPI